jgi:hypothetical protein
VDIDGVTIAEAFKLEAKTFEDMHRVPFVLLSYRPNRKSRFNYATMKLFDQFHDLNTVEIGPQNLIERHEYAAIGARQRHSDHPFALPVHINCPRLETARHVRVELLQVIPGRATAT